LAGLRILDAVRGGQSQGNVKLRAAFLAVSGSAEEAMDGIGKTFIDLVEYIDPPVTGEAYPSLFNVGLTRVAFRSADVTALYKKVLAAGVEHVVPPSDVSVTGDPQAKGLGYFCLVDPNGIVVEFVGPLGSEVEG
jgi:hypothetical protein